MANPLPQEDQLYEKLKSEGISFDDRVWDFFFHRISEDITAIIHTCEHGLDTNYPLKNIEARNILLCTEDVANIISTLTAASYEKMLFLQFKNSIPLHPLIRELVSHQIGNDIYAINLIVGDCLDSANDEPLPRECVEKILDHCASIREFLRKFKAVAISACKKPSFVQKNIYRGLYDSFSDGLLRIDINGGIQEYNKAFEDLFGGSRQDMTLFVNNLINSGKWSRMWGKTLQGEKAAELSYSGYEKEYVNKNGKIYPVAVSARMVAEEPDAPAGMWLVVRDISSQVQEQKELLREFWDTRTVIEKVSDGITLSDEKGVFEIFNRKMREITGYTKDEANQADDFSAYLYPDPKDRVKALDGVRQVIQNDGYFEGETAIRTKDGGKRVLFVTTSRIVYKGRDMFLSVYHDITEIRRVEAALREQEEFTSQLIKGAGFPVFVLDKKHKVIIWNKACEMLTGLAASGVIGTRDHWKGFYSFQRPCLADMVIDGEYNKLAKFYTQTSESKFLAGGRHAESWVMTPAGKELYLLFDAVPVHDSAGKLTAVIETIYDETELRRGEEQREILNKELMRVNEKMKDLALKDPHTGLYNFRFLAGAIEAEFDRARRESQPLSVMMIDFDYFKSINDVYGHQFGDLILKMAAIRLRRAVRKYDIVIRYGGEEFVIICPDSGHDNAVNLAGRIAEDFNSHPLGNEEYTVRLKLSIGVVSYPQVSVDKGIALVELADQVLAKVKELGGDRVFSDRDVHLEKSQVFQEFNNLESIKEKIERMNKRVNRNLLEELFAFARNSGLREHYTPEQMEKMVSLSVKIARSMNLDPAELEIVGQAAVIRDIGKMGLEDSILLNPGRLSEDEFSRAREHSRIGAEVLSGVPSLRQAIPAVLYHHERWDGTGYPEGLKDEQIPLAARIIGLADAYIALTSARPYHNAFPPEEARRMVADNSGKQFCPAVVDAFLKLPPE